jgi:tetratricopeptide (TPR) repeat protein
MIGERVAHYQIVEQLGRGGMGVVYRATDLKLARQVALKFLPDVTALTSGALDRFTREARSAAALNHPHICTIYEIGEHEGRPFIAMELLEGRTLADQISSRPLPIGRSIDIALQVASALDAAHASSIVHRDIKPANIFVTTAGVAKILDFGLAKSVSTAPPPGSPDGATTADQGNLTGVGSTLGTIAYMSPEQARGQELDGRSDIFSLGLVLYEMVTGRQAFPGETTAVVFDGILNRMPQAPSEINSDVGPDLERLIARTIAKDRAERYQQAADLAADLRALRRTTDSNATVAAARPTTAVSAAWPSVASHTPAPAPAPGLPRRRGYGTWIAAAVAVILLGGGLAYWQMRGRTQALAASDRILIADFANSTGDSMFDGTLKQALAVKLEESPFLNVVADQRVRETLAYMSRPQDTPVTAAVAREICQRQGIKAVMLGDIAMLGSSFVVTLTAENCETGDVLAREQVSAASKEQVLAAVGTAAATMRERLGESLASIQRMDKAIDQATTASLEALKAFSLGDEKRNTGSDQEAIPFFRRAIELDPNFALAHARLGTVYSNLGEQKPAVEHRTRAFELRERVSERERFYILGHYYSGVTKEIDKALETYDLWKQTYPRDPVPHINSGTLYSVKGESQRALDAYLKGLELDPMRRVAYGNAVGKYLELDRLEEAKALVAQQIKMLGETADTQFKMYEIAVRQGDRATADRYSAILEKSSMRSSYLQLRTVELFYHGRWRESQQACASLVELLKQQGLPERAALILSNQAVSAANIGELAAARQHAETAETMTNANPTGRSVDLNANLAVAFASLGDVGRARKHFGNITARDVPDAEFRGLITQLFEGLFAVKSGKPAQALERLASLPADGSNPLLINGFYVRAHANAALKRWEDAERDFRAVLERKPNRQYNIAGPLAGLGLARALARQGKTSEARDAYQKFLDGWSKADPDLKELKAAKAEVAALGT